LQKLSKQLYSFSACNSRTQAMKGGSHVQTTVKIRKIFEAPDSKIKAVATIILDGDKGSGYRSAALYTRLEKYGVFFITAPLVCGRFL
jgi:hypothetical protein